MNQRSLLLHYCAAQNYLLDRAVFSPCYRDVITTLSISTYIYIRMPSWRPHLAHTPSVQSHCNVCIRTFNHEWYTVLFYHACVPFANAECYAAVLRTQSVETPQCLHRRTHWTLLYASSENIKVNSGKRLNKGKQNTKSLDLRLASSRGHQGFVERTFDHIKR